jgi:hypothetical protein
MTWALLIAAVSGYVLGLTRPIASLRAWSDRRLVFTRGSELTWFDVVLWCVLHPCQALSLLRRRHDPQVRPPAPEVNERWLR